jgi:hypothetical protein
MCESQIGIKTETFYVYDLICQFLITVLFETIQMMSSPEHVAGLSTSLGRDEKLKVRCHCWSSG